MIQPLSQNISKYPQFKNSNTQEEYNVIGRKVALNINDNLDYQRKSVEQNERLIKLLGILTLTAILGTFLSNTKGIIELTKK